MNSPVITPIYTVGHSTHPQEHLIGLLKQYGVTALCDVRSSPFSRMNPQFNRPEIRRALARESIRYVFLGEELGARTNDLGCYEEGRVRYERLAQTPLFQRGLDRVTTGSQKFTVALMCAERDPLQCHRTILVARYLIKRGLTVAHICADGSLETQDKALLRLSRSFKVQEVHHHMFRSRDQLFEDLYELQERRIAYEIDRARIQEDEGNEETVR